MCEVLEKPVQTSYDWMLMCFVAVMNVELHDFENDLCVVGVED